MVTCFYKQMEILSTSRLVAQFRSCSFLIINNVSVREIGDAAAPGKRSLCRFDYFYIHTLFFLNNTRRVTLKGHALLPQLFQQSKRYMNYK